MKNMTLLEINIACKGTYYGDDKYLGKEVSSVVIDSRLVIKDSLFVPIRGAKVDGHSFITQTITEGALCTLSEEKLENADFPYILVPSCLQALRDLAEHYRKGLNTKIIGITGSVGKTSTKEMMASVLSQQFSVQKTPGNFNNEIGLPLTLFSITPDHEIAVVEMGISDFGDMNILSQMAQPDICILTNIGTAHIEYLKTRDGILKEKTQIFNYMNQNGKIYLNGDDDKLITVPAYKGIRPTFYGLSSNFFFHASDIVDKGLKGTTATYHTPISSFTAHINVPGTYMVYNALAAIAVAYSLGMEDENIIKGIESLKPISGRSHIIETGKYTIIDDCYNAGPTTMKGALELLSKATTRKVAILGDMFELGENEKQLHYEVGTFASTLTLDQIICIGSLANHIYKGYLDAGFSNILHFPTKDDFFEEIDKLLSLNDTILLKASNGMAFSQIVDIIKER